MTAARIRIGGAMEHYNSKSKGTALLSRTSAIDLQHLRYAVAAAETREISTRGGGVATTAIHPQSLRWPT